MAEDPQKPDDKSTPPPAPPQSAPPPAPPAAPGSPNEESAEPPVQIGGGESAAPVNKDAPGADASIGNRIVAYILDVLVVMGISFAVGLIVGFLPLPSIMGRLGSILGIAYILTRDALPFLDGQSIGKKAMKIRAVTMEGKALTGDWQPSIIRNVAFIIPFFALVELIILLTRQDKPGPLQRLGDEWAKTKVVNAEPAAPAAASSPPGDGGTAG